MRIDRLERFRLIEIVILWEGRLTTQILCDAFGISRQQASKDINTYINEISASNIRYDKHLKGYVPNPSFHPLLSKGSADEYINWIQDQNEFMESVASQGDNKPSSQNQQYTELVSLQSHPIDPKVLRPIVRAIKQKQSIDGQYISLSTQQISNRRLTPHTLVNNGIRWHVRAYCHDKKDFRDFVISRFKKPPLINRETGSGKKDDRLWNKKVTLKIIPHPKLSEVQQKIIANDYGMSRGLLKLTTNAALVQYFLQYLRIELKSNKPALQQPIILQNSEQIKPYLFSDNLS